MLPEAEGFKWESLGNLGESRLNLGQEMPVLVYRMLLYSMRAVMDNRLGVQRSDELLREAGYQAGYEFATHVLDLTQDFDAFTAQLQESFKQMKVGIVRFEMVDLENSEIVLTVDEDLDCSGLPMTGNVVCIYDEGLISGILHAYTGRPFTVREVDCWTTGSRTCRFAAKG